MLINAIYSYQLGHQIKKNYCEIGNKLGDSQHFRNTRVFVDGSVVKEKSIVIEVCNGVTGVLY